MKILSFLSLILCSAIFSCEGINYTTHSWGYTDTLLRTQSIHILEIDPTYFDLKPVKALDSGLGRESVLSIARRHKAKAAINAGFFSIGKLLDGRACGTLKIDNWYALPFKPRGCIGWSKNLSDIHFDRLSATVECFYKSHSISITGLNKDRKEGEAIVFTPNFHRTTLTYPDGEEVIVRNNEITDIRSFCGSSNIPHDGFVLSLQKNHPLFGTFEIGEHLEYKVNIQTAGGYSDPEIWKNLDFIVGGTPLLIYNGINVDDFSFEQTLKTFISKRHARTAIGILPNNHVVFVVVDKPTPLDGMTICELQNFMSSIGCRYALNLDGGGSSTLVFEDTTKNTPHGDEDEDNGKKVIRRVSDAILVISKPQDDDHSNN